MPARAASNNGRLGHLTSGSHVCRQWVWETHHTPEMVETENYFIPLWNHFGQTDEVKVVSRQPDGSYFKAMFEVLHSEAKTVIVERVTDWRRFGLDIGAVNIIDRGNGTFDIVEIATGRTIDRGVNGKTANALAAAYGSKLAVAAAQGVPSDAAEKPIAEMSRAELMSLQKARTGHGFNPSTTREEMVAALQRTETEAA